MNTNSDYTNRQLNDWMKRKIQEAKNPDPVKLEKEKLKKERMKRKEKIAVNNGL